MAKRKASTKRKTKKRKDRSATGGHDTKSRRKYDKGRRVEAYTFGEALGKSDWP